MSCFIYCHNCKRILPKGESSCSVCDAKSLALHKCLDVIYSFYEKYSKDPEKTQLLLDITKRLG